MTTITEITDEMRFAEARRLRIKNGSTVSEEDKFSVEFGQMQKGFKEHMGRAKHPVAKELRAHQRCFGKNTNLELITTVATSPEGKSISVADSNNLKLSAVIRFTTPRQMKAFDLLMGYEFMPANERIGLSPWDSLLIAELREIVLDAILDSSIREEAVEVVLTDDMLTADK